MKKKFLCLILALSLLLSLAACGGNNNDTPSEPSDPAPTTGDNTGDTAGEPGGFQPYTYEESVVYDNSLGEFYAALQAAKDPSFSLSQRIAMMGVAEAKMLESGVMVPIYTSGANYAIGRLLPRTVPSVWWGSDSNRYETIISITGDHLISQDERAELTALWEESEDGAAYQAAAKQWVADHGYQLADTYTLPYSSDPTTWDVLSTFQSTNSEPVCMTVDNLLLNDCKNIAQPALAESWDVSADGLTYTFHIRQGVKWVDSQGREVGEVKADDWVSSMQHVCDAGGGQEELYTGVIKGAEAYVLGDDPDFSHVGIEAVDDYTLVYTLEQPAPFFLSMLTYCGAFSPLSRSYYESQGGKYGMEFDNTAADYTYGASPDNIAYCGPYLITNYTEKNTIVYRTNPAYWNPDGITTPNHIWTYNDGSDALRSYNEMKAGILNAAGLNSSALAQARQDNLFEGNWYQSATSSTSYVGFYNLNRQIFANFTDSSVMVSPQSHDSADEIDVIEGIYTSEIEDDAARTHVALNNQNFRLAVSFAFDRGAYNGQQVGEELKYARLRNSYTPASFATMEEDVTIDINGVATTFETGTYYGAIMQAQLDADGYPIKVWDPDADDGMGSGDGFDGWYSVENAKKYLNMAIEELAAQGVEISAENPIYIDCPYPSYNESYNNAYHAYQQSVAAALDGFVVINLIAASASQENSDATYWPETGSLMNYDVSFNTGWSADYADPANYLDTLLPDGAGYSAKNFGLW